MSTRLCGFRALNNQPFKGALLLVAATFFLLSCSLSLNVSGPGDNPTPTAQNAVQVAVEQTLTDIARNGQINPDGTRATPDATEMAELVPTLVAQALLTMQPTEAPPRETRVPLRATHTPILATAEIIAPPPTAIPIPTDTPRPTDTPLPTETPPPTPTFTPTPTDTPTPTNTYTPTRVPTHCPQVYCVIMQRCEPGENTRGVGTIYENDRPKNGVRVRISYAMGGPPVIPDFISGNDPNNPNREDPLHPGYYQLGLLEGGALAGNWWVFIVNEKGDVISEGRYFNTQGQTTATSCQVAITDFYR